MQTASISPFHQAATPPKGGSGWHVTHVAQWAPRRAEAEGFIRHIFHRHYGAQVHSFAPHLLLVEEEGGVVAAAGWQDAAQGDLFLEHYLDEPIERLLERVLGQPLARSSLAEVGHLASVKPGGSLWVFQALAIHLHLLGYEWVVFTATRELIGIFTKLGIPLLALAKAEPSRLGAEAEDWGRYYDTRPIVVACRVRQALTRTLARA